MADVVWALLFCAALVEVSSLCSSVVVMSLRLLLVQAINQCYEESAGQRFVAAALLVTCRGWGAELFQNISSLAMRMCKIQILTTFPRVT